MRKAHPEAFFASIENSRTDSSDRWTASEGSDADDSSSENSSSITIGAPSGSRSLLTTFTPSGVSPRVSLEATIGPDPSPTIVRIGIGSEIAQEIIIPGSLAGRRSISIEGPVSFVSQTRPSESFAEALTPSPSSTNKPFTRRLGPSPLGPHETPVAQPNRATRRNRRRPPAPSGAVANNTLAVDPPSISGSPEVTVDFARENLAAWTGESQVPASVEQASPPTPPSPARSARPPTALPEPLQSAGTSTTTLTRPPGPYGDVRDTLWPLFGEIAEKDIPQVRRLRGWVYRALLLSPDDWGPIIDEMLEHLFPVDERKYPKVPKKRNASPQQPERPPNRTHRKAAELKLAQDLFNKNPRLVADAIAAGAPLSGSQVGPEMDDVMDVHGSMLESLSPPDREPHNEKGKLSSQPYRPITPEDVRRAKTGWRPSAPGCDGVLVPKVARSSDDALAVLFSLILASKYQPPEWMVLRTILVPKTGKDRTRAANWRPITIGSAVQRLLHRVVMSKVDAAVDLNKNQRGFVPTDGCLANVLILDSLMNERTSARRGLALVSLDIRKAFDSVSHHSIERAMKRTGVPEYLRRYIMATLQGSITSFFVGGSSSRALEIRRGVRQGDPLSPLLFNLVIDELLDILDSMGSNGCAFRSGPKCRALAFADDIVLVGEDSKDVDKLLRATSTFFERRGMVLHPDKCRALVLARSSGRNIYPVTRPGLQIDGKALSTVTDVNPMQYLGYGFDTHGVTKPNLTNYSAWLQRLTALPLRPHQKIALLRIHLLPRLLHFLMSPRTPTATLKNIDKVTRHYVKRMVHLHLHTSDALIHAPLKDGGLGIMEVAVSIPTILLRRISNLRTRNGSDEVLGAALTSDRVSSLAAKLEERVRKFPPNYHQQEIAKGAFSRGLEKAKEDPSSRSWITDCPKGWTGMDWVRAVHLRTANLPTVGIITNPVELRGCRAGCKANETICHILQACPASHDSRVARHNAIASKIASHCTKKGWSTLEEPQVRHQDGTLFKPDVVTFTAPDSAIVCDAQVSWETAEPMGAIWDRKRQVYDNAKFREAASRKWPGVTFTFLPCIIGARGIWPGCNKPLEEALNIRPPFKRGCISSVLKWGCSAHRSFMKRVWKRRDQKRFRTGNTDGTPPLPDTQASET